MHNRHYDLIVIGGGSGGLAVAEKAASYGRKVAVVEAANIGGTCVNNGCVPKKVMWYAAHLAQAVDNAGDFGVTATRSKTDWRKLVTGREDYISKINAYWNRHVEENGIDYLSGYARFVETKTIEVNATHYSADHIVIATGSRPIVPPVPGTELGITSEQGSSMTRLESSGSYFSMGMRLWGKDVNPSYAPCACSVPPICCHFTIFRSSTNTE